MSPQRPKSSLLVRAVLLTSVIIYAGCNSDSATPPQPVAVDETVKPAQVPDNVVESVEIPDFETAPPLTAPEFATPQEVLTAMQKTLEDSIFEPGKPPTKAAFAEAIKIGDEGRKKFPEDENLLIAAMSVRYKSLPFEDDAAVMTQRRLELGKLTRQLVQRRSESSGQIGNMAGYMLYEEAMAYLTQDKAQDAWNSLVEARSLGFDQARILFLDPTFQPVLNNTEALEVVEKWIDEDVQSELQSSAEEGLFSYSFELPALNRDLESVSLDDFKGKVVILDFWGTWCGPCRATIPHLIELHQQHPDDLAIVGINFENPSGEASFAESKAKLDAFSQIEPIPYLCLHGNTDLLRKLPGFRGFPTLLAIDKTGAVRSLMRGYQPPQVLRSIVNQLLSE